MELDFATVKSIATAEGTEGKTISQKMSVIL
jgi:hypothetical protein